MYVRRMYIDQVTIYMYLHFLQIYMLLADQDLDLCTQLSYVEKALALVRVFKMSYPSEHLVRCSLECYAA